MKLARFSKISERINRYQFVGTIIIFLIAIAVAYLNLGTTKDFIGDDAGVSFHYSDAKLNKESNMWDSYTFPGRSNVINATELIHAVFISTLHKIGLTSILVGRLFYFLCYFISGLGMYFLSFRICDKLSISQKNKIWIVALTGAVFYILNNFTMILLSFPPTSYIYSYILLPWIFLFYIKDFHVSDSLLKRLVFSIVFLLILSGNPSNTIGIVAILFLYEIFFREENKIIHKRKYFAITLLMIILLSSYIWLPTLGNSGNPYNISSDDIQSSIIYNSTSTSIGNLLRFQGHPAQNTFVFNKFLIISSTIFLNYLLLAIASFALLRKKLSRIEVFLLMNFVLFLFLAKSEHPPLAEVNKWIYSNIPFFGMYRASYFKFIYYCIFSFSILLSISLLRINEKISKLHFLSFSKGLTLVFPLLIIFYSAKPFFFGEVVNKIHKTVIPTEYHDINAYFSNVKTDFSVLSLPQLPSGLTLDWGNGNYYAGGANPDYFLLGRPTWSNGWFLPDNMTSNQFSFFKNVLSRTNVKYVFLHKDIPEEYSFNEVDIKGNPKGQTNFNNLNAQITKDQNFKEVLENEYFKVFEINQENFAPHFYTSGNIRISDQSLTDFVKDSSTQKQSVGPIIYFKEQNIEKGESLDTASNLKDGNRYATKSSVSSLGIPSLEYKKINPTKYRVRVHSATGQFPFVFSESFDNGWKVYLGASSMHPGDSDKILSNYKILDGNKEDQATKEELEDYIAKGLVSDLGDGKRKEIKHTKWQNNKQSFDYTEKYNIGFVSKNFQNTIQNDNLKNGAINETWFKAPIDNNENHLTVNGYANSWIIDSSKVCKNSNKCTKNADGSYDMELIVEFWPQRLFHIGLLLSGVTILLCLGCIVYFRKKRTAIRKNF